MPFIDLHAHYPMHTRFPPRMSQGPPQIGKEIEFWIANQLLNYQGGKPRVSLDELIAGADGGIGSVLYDPDDEFFHDASPVPGAFANLLAQLDNVEQEVAGKVTVVRNPTDLERCLRAGEKFLFHCVEGALALGGNAANVDTLASRGVAYMVVAHLFFRGVAGCENAFPHVPDVLFEGLLNPDQDSKKGLTELGRQVVDRLLQQRILIDITHANGPAQDEMFGMARDHGNAPVIASHIGVRKTSHYGLNLGDDTVRRIAASNGVIGIILAPYWLRHPSEQVFGRSDVSLMFDAIDWIEDITGSLDHVAIGSDLDGFIQPIHECCDYSQTPALVAALRAKYPGAADKILWGNALDVLQRGWKGV
jgi:microsomal dipeptidase-like Zn-dependent dipeptidase